MTNATDRLPAPPDHYPKPVQKSSQPPPAAPDPAVDQRHKFAVKHKTFPGSQEEQVSMATCRAPTIADDLRISGRKQQLCREYGINPSSDDSWLPYMIATLEVLIDEPKPAPLTNWASQGDPDVIAAMFKEVAEHTARFRGLGKDTGLGQG